MAAGGWLCGSPEGSGGLGVSELGPAPRAEGLQMYMGDVWVTAGSQ